MNTLIRRWQQHSSPNTKQLLNTAKRAFTANQQHPQCKSPFVNYPRKLSYAHGTLDLPLLSEHISERLRNITQMYP